ncbi:Flp pilus assembly protein CpaB [Vibrio maerlii]|uniref:Flp pilus assembly protein CpaB n=1 Tax=Vibrio maerlii TaxID=2231648 RepID=UPI000E3E8DA5|nr:Flp pilus assembly protein CpaB [Vibrio maerlii]
MNIRILVPIALIAVGAGLYGLSGQLIQTPPPSPTASSGEPVTQAEPAENSVTIWVTTQALTRGQAIDVTQFERQSVSEKEFERFGFVTKLERGMVVKQTVAPGTRLTPKLVATPQDAGYVEAVIHPDRVPYAIEVEPNAIIGGLIDHGTLVDVIAISSASQNLADDVVITNYQSVSVSPLFAAVKVLKVDKQETLLEQGRSQLNVNLILELTRGQLAKLSIARKISLIEVHKSFGANVVHELQANSGDVLPDYRAIVEYRAEKIAVK